MVLTLKNRLKLCWEVLTTRSTHGHPAHIKQLSVFIRGYEAGYKDCLLDKAIKRNNTSPLNHRGG